MCSTCYHRTAATQVLGRLASLHSCPSRSRYQAAEETSSNFSHNTGRNTDLDARWTGQKSRTSAHSLHAIKLLSQPSHA
jgi:hypothetical protein